MLQLIDPDVPITVADSELDGIKQGDPETVYHLRPISVDDHRRLSKQNTKDGIDPESRQVVKTIDFEALNDDLLDFCLTGWSGILLKGEPAPCSRENKLKLDGARRVALTNRAGMNQIARVGEDRAASFRQPA